MLPSSHGFSLPHDMYSSLRNVAFPGVLCWWRQYWWLSVCQFVCCGQALSAVRTLWYSHCCFKDYSPGFLNCHRSSKWCSNNTKWSCTIMKNRSSFQWKEVFYYAVQVKYAKMYWCIGMLKSWELDRMFYHGYSLGTAMYFGMSGLIFQSTCMSEQISFHASRSDEILNH